MSAEAKLKSPLANYLNKILELRRQRNPRYSLRALARDLNMNPGRLSEILALKYAPGHEVSEKMAAALKLAHPDDTHVWDLIEEHNKLFRETCGAKVLTDTAQEIIVDFDHYSLMNFMGTEDYSADNDKTAQRLGITKQKVLEMLDRLSLFGLIKMTSAGHYQVTNNRLTTTNDIPSDCLKEAHRRLIHHAAESLTQDPIDLRDISSITFALDPSCLPEAKEMIRDFRRRMAALFESGKKKEVYNLNIQLVPVTKSYKGS